MALQQQTTPDGKAVLVRTDQGADENWSIWRVNLDGSGAIELTPGERMQRDHTHVADLAPENLYFSARRMTEASSAVYAAPAGAPGPAREVYRDSKPGLLSDVSRDGKQALFEAVLDAQETRAIARITAAATASDPLEAARQALDAFLDQCCDPVYGRLVWLEGPTALGWHRWRECEQKYAYGLVDRFITALVEAGYLTDRARGSLVRFSFWMLGGAGLALAEAPEADRPRLREEWRYLIRQTISGLRAG